MSLRPTTFSKSSSMPIVSVIIATYNRAAYLKEAIESVLAQTYHDWELIIVNDGSTDSTRDLIDRYADQERRMRVLHQPNQGLSRSRNNAIRIAAGKYLAIIDDDDVWTSQKLAKQVAFHEANPHIKLSFTQAYLTDGELRPIKVFPQTWRCSFEALLERSFMPLPTVMVWRSCVDKVGGFDGRLSRSADYDLWLRITQRYKFECIGEPLCFYRRHGSNMSLEASGRHRAHLAIYHKLLAQEKQGFHTNILKRRIAQERYALGRVYREQHAYRLAAMCFAQSVATMPWVGLQLPGRQRPTDSLVYLIIKPYLAIAYCFLKKLSYAHR